MIIVFKRLMIRYDCFAVSLMITIIRRGNYTIVTVYLIS